MKCVDDVSIVLLRRGKKFDRYGKKRNESEIRLTRKRKVQDELLRHVDSDGKKER